MSPVLEDPRVQPQRVAPPPRRQPRVLLAEDDEALRALLASTLRGEGFLVDEVPDGRALLHALAGELDATRAPDLLVTDLRLPGASGLEAVLALRAHDPWLPVLMITAFGDPLTHARAREMGVDVILDKPFELEHLIEWAHQLTEA